MKLPSAAFLRENAPWLAAGALLTFSSSFGQTFFISVFAGEIQSEFGLSHGRWGAIYAGGTLISALIMVWAGVLTDVLRVRVLGVGVLALLALACLAMASVPAVWALVPVILALRFAGQGMSMHIAMTAMARYFVATRGRALATAAMGVAVGSALLPLIFVSLLTVLPWRSLWIIAAGFACLAIPILLVLLRRERTPQSVAEENQSFGLGGRHWSRAEAVRSNLFWCTVPLLMGPPIFVTALFFNQVHLAETKGWSHLEFVSLFPLYTIADIVALVASGILLDKAGTRRLMPLFQIPLIAGFVLMGTTSSLVGGACAMACIGFTNGSAQTITAAFWADFYGTRHLGAIRSLVTAILVLGTAIGPVLTGWLIDAGLDFEAQMPIIAGYFVLTSILVWAALRRAMRVSASPT